MENEQGFAEFLKTLKDMKVDAVMRSKVNAYGTGAHIPVTKKHLGKNALLIIFEDK